jgi:hypothetical protein
MQGRHEDPLLAVEMVAAVQRVGGDDPRADAEWLTAMTIVLPQRESFADVEAGLALDAQGATIDEDGLRVDLVVPAHRARAIQYFAAGDFHSLFGMPFMYDACPLDLFTRNAGLFHRRGLYEEGLVRAQRARRHPGWHPETLRWLLVVADRARLREASDPLPGPGPFTVYRGLIDSRGRRGLSWTQNLDVAACYAASSGGRTATEPAI